MQRAHEQKTNLFQFLPLFFCFFFFTAAIGFAQDRSSDDQQKVKKLFQMFLKTLKPVDLAAGSCVKNATDFYAVLLDNHIFTKNTRIVLIVREPNQGMPHPMYPNNKFLRGERPKFWIWHAFVVHQGLVYDANYINTQDTLGTYFKNFWGKDPNVDSFWVFSVPLRDFPKIAGSSYPGGPPRMLQFKPISWQEFCSKPTHTSQKK